MNRWTIVRNRLYGISSHITSNVSFSLEEPDRHPNHLKYLELQDILMPSLNRAVGLAIALSEIEDRFTDRKKVNKKMLIRKNSTQEFIKYFEITENTEPEPDFKEIFSGIYRECKEIISGRQPEHYAKIAIALVAVLRFIRVTGRSYGDIEMGMNSPKEFYAEILKKFEEDKAMIPKITWVEDLLVVGIKGKLTTELLKQLRFATTRVVMRLDNSNIEEMKNELS